MIKSIHKVKKLFFLKVDSCEDTRENTPDSDSGYVGSVVTVTSTSRTFQNVAPTNASNPAASSEAPKPSFLSEIQNAQRIRGLENVSATSASAHNGKIIF